MDILIFWCFRMVQQKKLRVSGLCIRHTQTAPVSIRGCLEVSDVVCCRLLISWVPWSCLEGVWGISGGCLGISEWYSWKLEALRRVWGVSGIPVLTVWSRSIFFSTALKPATFFAGPFWNIKIYKCPYIRFPKIIGLRDFFVFESPSEINYKRQLQMITL